MYWGNMKVLEEDKLKEAIIQAKSGDLEARNMVLESFIGLFLYILHHKYGISGDEASQYMGEVCIQAVRAIEKYDVNGTTKFSSYVSWWIRAAVYNVRNENSTQIKCCRKTFFLIRSHNEENMEVSEIAEKVGQSEKIVRLLIALSKSKSIDDLESGFSLAAVNETPFDHMSTRELEMIVAKAMKKIRKRERKLIRLYYGFDQPAIKSGEIAKRENVSTSMIGQVRRRGERKLKDIVEPFMNEINSER